jgi:Flp pilus assembly pilin Flp
MSQNLAPPTGAREGPSAIEYVLILALISIVAVATLPKVENKIRTYWETLGRHDFGKITGVIDSLPQGQVAYDVPLQMELNTQYPFHVYLSQQKPLSELEIALRLALKRQPIETHQVKIAPVMQATLDGDGFSISPEGPVTQAVDARMTEWRWNVIPERGGKRQLHLRLDVILNLDGKDYPHAVQTFDQTVEVKASFLHRVKDFAKDNWAWCFPTIPFILGAVWKVWQKRLKPAKRWEEP